MLEDFKHALYRHKRLFWLVMVIVILSKVATIMPAIIIGRVVDTFTQHTLDSETALYLLGFICVGVINVILIPIQGYYLTRFIQKGLSDVSIRWVREIFTKHFDLFSSINIGKMLKSIERGIQASERILNYALITILPLCIEFIVISAWLVWIANIVFLALVLALSGVYLALTHYLITWRRAHIDAVNDAEDEQAGVFANTIQAGKQIRLERAQESGLKPLFDTFYQYADAATKVGYSAAVLGASRALFLTLTSSTVIGYGIFVRQASVSELTVGDFVVLFTLSTMFFNTVFSIGEVYRFADQFSSDYAKFRSILREQSFKGKAESLPLDSDSLIYPASTALIAEGVSLVIQQAIEVRPGEHLAIVGASGSGKSTFVELLVGVKQRSGLTVRIGQTALESIAEEEHFRLIRYCPQTPKFLSGNLADAVFFHGSFNSTFSSVAAQLNIQHLFDELPVRTINQDATSISGGEAKKLSLLRVLLRPGNFNIFDEPTSSVDPQGASLIWDALFTCFADKSLICVTHDFTVLNHFDRVIVFDTGRIVADGKWQDLVALESVSNVIRKVQEEEPVSGH